ncbi:MAG: transposase [Bacteroidetes bacterium]|nr:transposase [Bacteroidota bacterium]
MHESLHIILNLVLPEGIQSYFELKDHKFDNDNIHLYLEELNQIPEEYKAHKLESKGFHSEITFQDFPLRGKEVFMHVKRRRWLNHDTGKVVSRDWSVVANGTRISKDFAAFLKQIHRYAGS